MANRENTVWDTRTAFTRLAITPPKVIWVKFGTLWAKCWGLALVDFGRDSRSSDSLRGSRIFCHANKALFYRFHVKQILRHLNTATSIGKSVKTFETKFWKFCHKGSLFQKTLDVRINSKSFHSTSFPWAVHCAPERDLPKFSVIQ